MGETRSWEITTTYRVDVDTESWRAVYGVDPADADVFGQDVAGWLRETAQQSLALASDVTGKVTATITVEPHEVTAVPLPLRFTLEKAEESRGCWLEGSRGWRTSGTLVSLAAELGMPLSEDDQAVLSAYMEGDWAASLTRLTLPSGEDISLSDVGEYVVGQGELAEKAETWLNANVAPEGWTFGWHDGEFVFWPDSEWDEAAN